MDYRRYQPSWQEMLLCAGGSAGLTGIIAWLFYRSVWGMSLFVPVYILCIRKYCMEQKKRRKDRLTAEFKDAMQAVAAALLAGYSMENAWKEAQDGLVELHGENGMMLAEVRRINEAVRMNEPMERMLSAFAERSGCEEIESFAEVFSFAKRGGGDFVRIIQTSVQKLTGRLEVEKEIATVLAGKRLEGRIMNGMPIAILAYMRLTSGGFLDVLYGNGLGVAVMSGALICYLAALRLSEHILDIQI